MSLHNELQRRKKYNYTKELDEVVDEIKTERFLDKEDVDAPIIVSKEQLMAKRRENNGVEDYEPPENRLSDKLRLPIVIMLMLSLSVSVFIQKIFLVFYIVTCVMLMFALSDTKIERATGAKVKAPMLPRVIFGLFALASLALAIYLTIQWK
jgi:hypothetical protein